MLVVATHTFSPYLGQANIPLWLNSIGLNSARGVQLFFMLSALTLFLSMQFRSSQRAMPAWSFFLRRFFRIAPMYYVGIAYYLLLGFVVDPSQHPGGWELLSVVTFTNWLSPFWIQSVPPGGWSITVEMTFYLFVPLLFAYVTTLRRAIYGFIVTCLASYGIIAWLSTLRPITDQKIWEHFLIYFFPAQAPIFLLGIVCYFLVTYESRQEDTTKLATPLVILACMLMYQLTVDSRLFGSNILYCLAFLGLILGLKLRPARLFVNPVMIFFGKISFSMYLIHFAIITMTVRYDFERLIPNPSLNYGLRFLVVLGITATVAYATNYFFEVPGQRLGKRIIRRIADSRLAKSRSEATPGGRANLSAPGPTA